LSSGCSSRLNEAIDEFTIVINLTDAGEQNYSKVIELVYMNINKLRQEEIKEHVFEEIKEHATIEFDNSVK
jgi:secreted Zn-dependent insulinase-like peptidase